MICLKLNFFYSLSMLQFSQFVKKTKISGDQKRFFIAYPLSFFANTPLKVNSKTFISGICWFVEPINFNILVQYVLINIPFLADTLNGQTPNLDRQTFTYLICVINFFLYKQFQHTPPHYLIFNQTRVSQKTEFFPKSLFV